MNPRQDSARGLNQLEGLLLWAAEVEEARSRAARFTEELPWLTTAQREEVERVYRADRIAASRDTLVRIRDRAVELRGEYENRYRQLRARCVGLTAAAVAGGAGTAITALLTRR
ncbi:hypothetical protein [Streptomyces griseoflavus]|uniref:hypothetical protein n=1 Tax=Streptomyces griseoflavus TaxID=35619 RepID=UPI00167DCED3|nr:hypothetical protein [Streptomyces griseoflavus]GGV15032.1 hypothetical protein GCM10010293_07600 [Streptomyces griseoflavus]